MEQTRDKIQINNPLGYEKISKLLYQFSIPAIIGMMVNALYNVVDRMFIGNAPDLGANGLAGITISFPAMIITLAIGILFGQGGATVFSISLGQGKIDKAEKSIGNAVAMLIIVGAVITILGEVFLKPLMTAFGASEAVLPYSMEYMRIIFMGTIFQVLGMGFNNFLRAIGEPKLAMITMFVGAGVNILLDPLFIFVFKMGMSGAATATVISQLISLVWSASHFLKKDAPHRLRIENMKIVPEISKEVLMLGLPGFMLQLATSVLNLILNTYLARYGGDIAISGMGIINSIQMLMIMPIIGLNQGLQPIVSFNYGAKNYTRVRQAATASIIVATIISFSGFLLAMFGTRALVGLFNRQENLMNFGVMALRIWIMCLPVVGFQIVGSNFFQAIGKPKIAMLLTLTRQVIILMPAIIIFSKISGLNGILYSAPFADLSSAILTSTFFFSFMKKLKNTPAN